MTIIGVSRKFLRRRAGRRSEASAPCVLAWHPPIAPGRRDVILYRPPVTQDTSPGRSAGAEVTVSTVPVCGYAKVIRS